MSSDSKLHHLKSELPGEVDCSVAEVLDLLAEARVEPGDAFIRGALAVIPRRRFPPDILDGDLPLLTDKDVPF